MIGHGPGVISITPFAGKKRGGSTETCVHVILIPCCFSGVPSIPDDSHRRQFQISFASYILRFHKYLE